MTDDSTNFDSSNRFRPARLSAAVEAELHLLTDALVEQTITPAQRRRLEEIVRADAAAAEVYLEIMYEWASLPNYVAPALIDLSAVEKHFDPPAALQMNETMILPAVHLGDVDDSQDLDSETAHMPPPAAPAAPVIGRRRWWFGAAAAAVLVVAATAYVMLHSSPETAEPPILRPAPPVAVAPAPAPAATITAVAADAAKLGDISLGKILVDGQPLRLSDGAIELTFLSGAIVVVQSPARLHLINRNALALDDGAISAHVPVAAQGFRVISPGLLAVDHGTDFGVRTLPDSAASEVHIFGGIVGITGTDSQGRPDAPPIRAVTGNAYRHDAGSTSAPAAVAFAPQSFNRDIDAIRKPVLSPNTGDQLAAGASDSHWIIVSAPDELQWKPQPAVVVDSPLYTSEPDSPDDKWLSTDASSPHLPAGLYVFRTAVDLKGFNPATVNLQAAVTADDGVADIKINGVSTGLSTPSSVTNPADFKHTVVNIPSSFWRNGVNQVDVIVRNENAGDGTHTQMGLQLRWTGTGCTQVQR